MEINSVVILFTGLLALRLFGPRLSGGLAAFMRFAIQNASRIELTPDNIGGYLYNGFYSVGSLLFPMVGLLVLTGLAVNFAQVGFYASAQSIAPKFDKINPISGLKRLFSLKSVVNLGVALAKVTVIGLVCYLSIDGVIGQLLSLTDQSVGAISSFLIGNSFQIALRVCTVLVIVAVLDYAYQRWEHEKGLRMTKQEVKEELRQYEGDPLIRSRVRRIQRQVATQRMMAAVPKADVVITNPTHLAVAIKYEAKKMNAPIVVAKGARLVAEKIKRIAAENNVPVLENKPLAQTLYKGVKVGQEIPAEFYQALAEILAYVYRLGRNRVSGRLPV